MRILSALFAVAVLVAAESGAVAQFTAPAGGGQAVPTIKSSVAMHFVVCVNGAFPSAYDDGTLHTTDRTVPLIGEIRVMAFTNVPPGWAECFGQASNVNQNINLFSVLFYNYGGAGTLYQMPNFYGFVPIGVGQGPGLPNYALAQPVGYENTAWLSDALPAHTHGIPSGNTGSAGAAPAMLPNMQPSMPINFLINGGGEIMIYGGTHLPSGFVVCDGSLRQIAVDTGLYNIIGTTYGGDGVTTFALPDLRGRSPIGTGTSSQFRTYYLGQTNGAAAVTLTTTTLPQHDHTILGTGTITGITGGSFPYDARQPTLAMTWLINWNGYPPTTAGVSPYAGEMRLFAGQPPANSTGWLLADGTSYGNVAYPGLHNAIGTVYGGSGPSFAVPRLNTRMAAGVGNSFSSLGVGFDREFATLSITNMPQHVHGLPVAPKLSSVQRLGDGTCQFSFTNIPHNSFTLLTSTNAALPVSNWTSLGAVTDPVPGQYQVTFAPTNGVKGFYRMRLP